MNARVGPFHHREVSEFVWQRRFNPRYAGPIYHMPFPGHRTQKEVREQEGRHEILRRLGR